MNKWLIGGEDLSGLSSSLSEECGISPLSADILLSQGICNSKAASVFFGNDGELDEMGLYSPFDIPDMQKAAQILNSAVEDGTRIFIYGDYDCDGIMATAALYNYLSGIGADVHYFINERADGYGMNINNVRKLAESGAELIVTVDNGISAVDEAALCRELGVRLVITDHHTPPPVLPDAEAVVDPHIASPDNMTVFRDICGCMVVIKLISAMEGGDSAPAVEMMSDLAACATLGDVMPLMSENRTIVKHGLHCLENTDNLGMKALLERIMLTPDGKRRNISIDSKTVAFMIVPRINASGRMGSAMDAAELFTTDDKDRADELAALLCSLNDKRKNIEDAIIRDIFARAEDDPSMQDSPVLAVCGKEWHRGVIGIAAAKVCETTGKPAFVMSLSGGTAVGSARAPEGYSVYKALFGCSDIMEKFGGHVGAGGFTIKEENIPEFERRLRENAKDTEFEPTIKAVRTIRPDELTVDIISRMHSEMEPFGEKNPAPVFLIAGAEILRNEPLSKGKYTKVTVRYGRQDIGFPMFDTPFGEFPYENGCTVNIMAVPGINVFNGNVSVTLDVKDIRRCGVNQTKLLNAEKEYLRFRRGNVPEKRIVPIMIPERDDYAAVYRLIPADGRVSEGFILAKLMHKINLCRLRIALDALTETGLVAKKIGYYTRLPVEKGKKTDFSSSPTINRLNSLL